MVQFYGAPPMALLTVGAGALLLGPGLIGSHAAITIDAVLWPLGTITGLASSLAVPYLMFTRLQAAPDAVPMAKWVASDRASRCGSSRRWRTPARPATSMVISRGGRG